MIIVVTRLTPVIVSSNAKAEAVTQHRSLAPMLRPKRSLNIGPQKDRLSS